MHRKRILVVEDDAAIRRGLVDALASPGTTPWKRERGPRDSPRPSNPTATCSSSTWSCPGCDGLAILREVRAARSPLPVIILTARGSEGDRVRGLDPGRTTTS